MIICECGNIIEVEEKVCKNCGLVYIEKEIVNLPQRNTEDKIYMMESSVSSITPDLESHTYHSKNTSNKELNRAFAREIYYQDNDKNYYSGMIEIKRIGQNLSLSSTIIAEACFIYKKLLKDNFFKKYHRKNATIAATLFIAAKKWECPIIFSSISEAADIPLSKIRDAFIILMKEYDFRLPRSRLKEIINIYWNKFNEKDFQKYIKMLEIAEEIEKTCKTMGKSPMGYAAAIFYLVLDKTRKEVSEIMDVSMKTITVRKQEISKIIKKGE